MLVLLCVLDERRGDGGVVPQKNQHGAVSKINKTNCIDGIALSIS